MNDECTQKEVRETDALDHDGSTISMNNIPPVVGGFVIYTFLMLGIINEHLKC